MRSACAEHADALARYGRRRQQWAEATERYRASLAGPAPLPDLVPAGSSAIREFGLRVTEHDAVSLPVRLFDDDRVLIVTSVRFDP